MSSSRIEAGKESVWNYPRLEETSRRIEVAFGGVMLACAPGTWGW